MNSTEERCSAKGISSWRARASKGSYSRRRYGERCSQERHRALVRGLKHEPVVVLIEEKLEDMSGLQSPCGDEGDVLQGVEGGVAVVSRILASGGDGVNKKPRGILSMLERTRSELEGGGVSADLFARGVHDSWRIGKHGCDNGFLLVASQADRTFAISVGKGLEQFLTSKDRNAALNAMKPLLREGDWDSAILKALEEINGRLRRSLPVEADEDDGEGSDAKMYTSLLSGKRNVNRSRAEKSKRDGYSGDGDGDEGSGGGEGGGDGLFGGWNVGGFFERTWSRVTPVSTLLALSLLWGGAKARSFAQRRHFEAKLRGIEAERLMPRYNAGGWSVKQEVRGSAGACPICLDTFAVPSSEVKTPCTSVGGCTVGEGLIGADGVEVATLPCGHSFCRSCLERWHKIGSSAKGPCQSTTSHANSPCPICHEATPALGDPRLACTRRTSRRLLRPRGEAESVKFSRERNSPVARGRPSSDLGSSGLMGLRFMWTGSNRGSREVTGRNVPPPPPPPPKSRPIGGSPEGVPLTPVKVAPRGMKMDKGGRVRGRKAPTMISGYFRQTDDSNSRQRANREVAFRLASLGSQYPAFVDDRIVNRVVSNDKSSSWRRDPLLARNHRPGIFGRMRLPKAHFSSWSGDPFFPTNCRSDINGDMGGHRGSLEKGSGWVSNRSRDDCNGGAFSGEHKHYSGGSSASATSGGW